MLQHELCENLSLQSVSICSGHLGFRAAMSQTLLSAELSKLVLWHSLTLCILLSKIYGSWVQVAFEFTLLSWPEKKIMEIKKHFQTYPFTFLKFHHVYQLGLESLAVYKSSKQHWLKQSRNLFFSHIMDTWREAI